MTFFFQNEFQKNNQLISKERYLIKQPIPLKNADYQFMSVSSEKEDGWNDW
jgi:hypothetical protein